MVGHEVKVKVKLKVIHIAANGTPSHGIWDNKVLPATRHK